MKKSLRFFCAALIVALLLPSVLSGASFDDYKDVAGHWASSSLKQAYNDGLIDGKGEYLLPDDNITAFRALYILCRVLDAKKAADLTKTGLSGNEWYYDCAAKAVYLGLVSSADVKSLNKPVSRQDAFTMLAKAFQIIEVNPDMSLLNQFSDSGQIKRENRQALASLVSRGFIGGSNGQLDVEGPMTLASFVSVIYRIVAGLVPASSIKGNYNNGVLIRGSAILSGNTFKQDVWFDCKASDISLSSVSADSITVRSGMLNSLRLDGSTKITRLTLAAQSGDIVVSPDKDAFVGTLIIGSGNGAITSYGIKNIEITGDNRQIIIAGNADSVILSGQNCTVSVQKGAKVGSIELLPGATRSSVIADGNVGELEIKSLRSSVKGSGKVETLKQYRNDTTISVASGKKTPMMEREAQRIIQKVTVGYKGDYTLEWALANDLDDYEKEVWINAKDYTSESEYLLWINLAYQRVNIFRRSVGNWELIRTCLAGTGKPGRDTPPGVWTTSYKELGGWTTATYTVKPVVRFKGSIGYAFHSRLYYPGTENVRDASIGFPISSGCIRMYDDDIWFIYNNIPDGTTVVVH